MAKKGDEKSDGKKRAAAFFVGRFEFRNKTEALKEFSLILNSAPLREPLTGIEDEMFRSLLVMHPRAEAKIGCGIEYLFFDKCKFDNKTRVCVLKRVDGSFEDFSYKKCFDGDRSFKDLSGAMRKVVQPQISEFRDRMYREYSEGFAPCGVTGEVLPIHAMHVDHEWPDTFEALLRRWLAVNGISAADVKTVSVPYEKSEGRLVGRVVADEAFACAFSEFHAENAHLRLVEASVNLRGGNRKIEKPKP